MSHHLDSAHLDSAHRDSAHLDAPRVTPGGSGVTAVPRHARALILAPSGGLGGGIERFLSTVETAFQQEHILHHRVDLLGPNRSGGIGAKLRFVTEVTRAIRASVGPVRLVIAHPNLLPIVHMVGRFANFAGATVIFYGIDIWSDRVIRARRVLRQSNIRAVTISNFSAAALAGTCHANVLYPGLSPGWYDTLVKAAAGVRPSTGQLRVVTAFRLADWRDKGLDTLLDALHLLGDDRVQLTVCGAGPVPDELQARLRPYPWCRIAADVSDQELAEQLAAADVAVLATRTRFGAHAYGEGFGLVLIEAQVAGTPVIAPAYGGSGEAFQPGLTGLSPLDESPRALAAVLATLLGDDQRRADMARAAAAWSRARFEPSAYGKHAVETLLTDVVG